VSERTRAWKISAASVLGGGVLRLLAMTWRVRLVNGEVLETLRAARAPFIFALWHGQLLPLIWQQRGQGVAVLISEHGDGEIIARVAEGLGLRTVRGSTTRGGGRALIRLIGELRDGHEIAVTPDGPRGPARQFAPGALVAAHRAAAPSVPIAAGARRYWQLKSWDGFIIPKPFTRVTVAVGDPVRVEAAAVGDAAADAPRLEAILNALSATAAD
jgi:lysophospholipid acyltransferase (LPLAT)-like uncharacterized protein